MRRYLACALVPLAVAATAAGCGDDSSDDETDASASAPADESSDQSSQSNEASETGSWPVTIDHALGSTDIEERPDDIVVLNVQWADVLTSLEVQPAGYMVDETSGETGLYPWQEGTLDGATEIRMTSAVPFEEIAELQPDLILGGWQIEEDTYSTLSEIAPTIGLLGDRDVDPWQDMAEAAGQFLGMEDQAEELIADVEGQVAATADELPGLEGKTFSFFNFVPGDAIYVVGDPDDGANTFFQELGLVINPTILELEDGTAGRVEISLEEADLLDADLLVGFGNDTELSELPGYSELPAVENDSVVEVGFEEAVALNTPTPLSIPYMLDTVRPGLEATANA